MHYDWNDFLDIQLECIQDQNKLHVLNLAYLCTWFNVMAFLLYNFLLLSIIIINYYQQLFLVLS